MSVGSNLQEMENVVTKGAAASEAMPKSGSNASGNLIDEECDAEEDERREAGAEEDGARANNWLQ